MKICLDATITHVDFAGSGTYAQNLIAHLQAEYPADTFELLYGAPRRAPRPGKSLTERIENIYLGTLWEFGLLPLKLYRTRPQPDVIHSLSLQAPPFGPAPLVITIHDPSVILFPHYFNWWFRTHSRVCLPRLARRASRVITVSEFSRQEIHRHLGVPLERIAVTYDGVSPDFRPLAPHDPALAGFRRRYDLPGSFILHVGSFEPRKNLPALLEAFEAFKADTGLPHQLVFTGGVGWKQSGIAARIAGSSCRSAIRVLGHVPQADLPQLYNAAELFVYPSLYEGFGMPVIEAMACGCPAVTSNAASLPEVAGVAGLLVDPNDSRGLAGAMQRVLQDPALARQMRSQGLQQAATFSWQRCARETMQVYRQAAGRPAALSVEAS